MKNSLKLILLCACIITAFSAFAQTQKIGHIDTGKLLDMMPQIDSAKKKLELTGKQYQDELKRMSEDYQLKVVKYEEDLKKGNLPLALQEMRKQDLMDLQTKIQSFQESASQDLEDLNRKVMEPIYKVAKDAIAEVAKEKGYAYVFDTSAGALLYWQESDDLLPAVKLKLKITKPTPPDTEKK